MSGSAAIEAALDLYGLPDKEDARSSQHPCEGAKFHSPWPLATRHWSFLDGKVAAYLCPTCEAKLEILLHLTERSRGSLTWPVRREFGNRIRNLSVIILRRAEDGR